jgi:amino acid transporter
MAYLTVFPSLARLRRTHPDVPRPYRVPGGIRAAKFVSLLTTFWIAVGVTSLIWPGLGVGWFGTAGDPDADLRAFGFGGQRLLFEVTQVVPLLVLIGVAVLFFLRGRATRADEVDVPFAEEFEPVHDEGMRA